MYSCCSQGYTDGRSGRWSLVSATASNAKWPILAGLLPRLCLIGFNYSQLFLINATVNFVSSNEHEGIKNLGYVLIAATAIIYIGIAIRCDTPLSLWLY